MNARSYLLEVLCGGTQSSDGNVRKCLIKCIHGVK